MPKRLRTKEEIAAEYGEVAKVLGHWQFQERIAKDNCKRCEHRLFLLEAENKIVLRREEADARKTRGRAASAAPNGTNPRHP